MFSSFDDYSTLAKITSALLDNKDYTSSSASSKAELAQLISNCLKSLPLYKRSEYAPNALKYFKENMVNREENCLQFLEKYQSLNPVFECFFEDQTKTISNTMKVYIQNNKQDTNRLDVTLLSKIVPYFPPTDINGYSLIPIKVFDSKHEETGQTGLLLHLNSNSAQFSTDASNIFL